MTAYFRAGHNAASAAARLGVHERTGAYRIRSIEQALGETLTELRADLDVALRLHRVLFTAASASPSAAVERDRLPAPATRADLSDAVSRLRGSRACAADHAGSDR